MIKYRKKEEVLVTQWTGDKSTVDDIREVLDLINKDPQWAGNRFEIGYSDVEPGYIDEVLYLYHHTEYGTSTSVLVYMDDYIILDLSDDYFPFKTCEKEYLDEHYIPV